MGAKLPEYFLKERFEKNLQYFTVYDNYRPNYNIQNVARKFYSAQTKKAQVDTKIMQDIYNTKNLGPKDKHTWPETENQWYGWFNEPFVRIDKNDSRFWQPIILTNETRHELRVKAESQHDPKFTGIPFKL